jgi:hypothetical protein
VREVCTGREDILLSERESGVKAGIITVRRGKREASASRISK